MQLYECILTFHDNLFYETRTMGRLYETGRLLHNIALCYALGRAKSSYYHAVDVPNYHEELASLNADGIYVTPAGAEDIHYVVNLFKYGDESYSLALDTVEKRRNVNRPNFGYAKEIAVNSRFRFGVLSEQPLKFPTWVRMGLWMSKAYLSVTEIPLHQTKGEEFTVSHYPLNPQDLPDSAELKLFDLVSMRPSSLVENALIQAETWWQGEHPKYGRFHLPVGMKHRV